MQKNYINYNTISNYFDKVGYIANDDVLDVSLAGLLAFGEKELNVGQNIYAVCLQGPMGSGKTLYAETYAKLAAVLSKKKVHFIEYTCNRETNTSALYEETNLAAIVKGDSENAILARPMAKAIKLASSGERVVLFIDEYDKAKKDIDSLFLQFTQNAKINTIQLGDLQVPKDFTQNLQLIICKNNNRQFEKDEPILRRMRFLNLDIMQPEDVYKLCYRHLVDERSKEFAADKNLINLASFIYEEIYNNRDKYDKLPAEAEIEQGISDANAIAGRGAKSSRILKIMLSNIIKLPDDQELFEQLVKKNAPLYKIITEMRDDKIENNTKFSQTLKEQIIDHVLGQSVVDKQLAIEYYHNKAKKLLEVAKERASAEKNKPSEINVHGEKLVRKVKDGNYALNFKNTHSSIKRGEKIADNEEWTKVASLKVLNFKDKEYLETMMDYVYNGEFVAYENGFILNKSDILNIAAVRTAKEGKTTEIEFLANSLVVPAGLINNIGVVVSHAIENSNGNEFVVSCLTYNNRAIKGLEDLNGYKNTQILHYDKANVTVEDLDEFVGEITEQVTMISEVDAQNISDSILKDSISESNMGE